MGVTLDPISFGDGGLEFSIGSHRKGFEIVPGDGFCAREDLLPYPARSWDLQPGDCQIYSAMLAHRTGAAVPRPGGAAHSFVVRWLGDDAVSHSLPAFDQSLSFADAESVRLQPTSPVWSAMTLLSACAIQDYP